MSKTVEHILLGIGGVMFISAMLFWLAVILAPLGVIIWFVVKYLIPQWTAIHTFGVIIILGLFSGAWILNSLISSVQSGKK